jgi:DNA polymerase delta subunit 1
MAVDFSSIRRGHLSSRYSSNETNIAFMLTDIDYYLGESPGYDDNRAILRIYGVTEEGFSVLVNVHNFCPYFWTECSPSRSTTEYLDQIMRMLNNAAQSRNMVEKLEIDLKESILNYTGHGRRPFLKVFTPIPKNISSLRNVIEKNVLIDVTGSSLTYESNIPFALRFMIDTGIVGMCWLELPGTRYTLISDGRKKSTSQIEADIIYTEIIVHKPEGEWSKIPPLRVLSFDIECNNNGLNFPTPDKNEVIQIGNICKIPGSDHVISKCIFTLGQCAEIADAKVCCYDREEDMLMGWKEYITNLDPDIITGYNILNFDYNYLFKRAERLKLRRFPYMGRIKDSLTSIKDTTFQSKAQGLRETKEINMEGRIQLDMFQHIQKEHKLSHYSLNSVSLTFLKEQKEDVHWTIMKDLQEGSEENRRRIAVYCLKDCYLPLRLLEKLMCLYNYAEMARVTGVSFTFLLTRGQQIKVASQLLRKANSCNMLMPTIGRSEIGDKYEGAFVLEPKRNYYKTPIATLDFASLYPSIMMAHNLCYCTLVPNSLKNSLSPEDYTITPTGELFVKPHIRKGLLPVILEELIDARKKARDELKNTSDPFMKKVLDGRQLALKISANSVYGFTGAQVGQLPCLQISSSVTAYGRIMIEATKNEIESYYCKKNGYATDADVVYGDTDSVMINFGIDDLHEVMKLGKEAAFHVTKQFINPIRLEFEKVYYPYLLLNKKRYAGLLWTNPNNYDKIDMKGIESVRRDNCQLVRETINTCLHKLLIERNLEGTIDYVKNVVSALLQNKIDLSLLVITKAIGKKQKQEGKSTKNTYTAKQAHVELAQKMQQRDAANAPTVGDRVAYVMIKGTKGQKAYELAEDPIYVLKNDLPIDFDFYLEKQLKAPLMRIFEDVIANSTSLFNGEHTRKRYQPKVMTGALSKFITVTNTCIGCKTSLRSGYLCENCMKNASGIYMEKIMMATNSEKNFQELWAECQRCQGSICQEVLCTNRDCPIFYRREKVKKEMDYVKADLEKLSMAW